jgi:hypothetical protein
MPLIPPRLPLWAYPAAFGAAFLAARLVARPATAPVPAGEPATPSAAAAADGAVAGGGSGGFWGDGGIGALPAVDPYTYAPLPTPTDPVPPPPPSTPPPAASPTGYKVTYAKGTYYRYTVSGFGGSAPKITGRSTFRTDGFSASCTAPKNCTTQGGTGKIALVLLTSGSRSGWFVQAYDPGVKLTRA